MAASDCQGWRELCNNTLKQTFGPQFRPLDISCTLCFMLFCTLLVLIFTRVFSTLQFWTDLRLSKTPPRIPYSLPLLGHACSLAWDPVSFVTETCRRYSWTRPLQVKAGWTCFTILTNPKYVQQMFRASRQLSNKPGVMFSVKNVLGTPPECFRIYEEDDSGVDETPRQGSTTKQEDRIYYHQHHSAKKYLSAQHLSCLSERFIVILRRNLKIVEPETHDGGGRDRWVAFPDLYSFLQQHAGGATIETLMGSEILRLNPTLINDFWLFERSIPGFVRCLPRWLIPGKYRNRDRVLDALKKWHVHGHTHSDCSKIEPNDPEWDLYFGSKLVKARQLYSDKMKAMNADACASEDLGLLFASNSNSIPIIFWIIFEALKDHQLRKRLVSEVASCLCPNLAQFDMLKLLSQPLLQSSFAETLRLRTTTGVLRVSEHTLCNIGDYTIERGHQMIVFTRPIALNVAAWTQAGRPPTQPLEEFQADRFLVPTKETASTDSCSTHDDRRFSLEGLTGCWLPFGGGQSMCPGRHFAKRQVLSAFALFFTDYELELSPTVDVNKVLSDKGSVSIGGLPPVCKVPFRIRKREPVVDFT